MPRDTLRLALGARNLGPDFRAAFYFGVLLPDGVTLFFFSQLSPLAGVMTRIDAGPQTFRALVANILIPQGLDVMVDDVIVCKLSKEPEGNYRFFGFFTPAGAFSDDRIDAGDILAIDIQSLTILCFLPGACK